ncbi:MAG TPA: SRPBCC family protein [Actinomycetaceae bacterium]|nr:SRPBCC family protein [Actinomycetaceae bacterium]
MVDVSAQIGAVTRELRDDEVDGAPARVQSLTQTYDAGIADVWEATTTPERIARWFLPVSGDLRTGGRYELTGNASGEILECEPPADGAAHYRITWEFGGGVSWVRLGLTSQGADRTTVTLEHTAPVDAVPAEMWDTFGPGATGVGWEQAFLGLALHLGAQDAAVSPEEAEAWVFSDEGQAFLRAAADSWAAAHVAAGADEATAARAADATFGFYTGQLPTE